MAQKCCKSTYTAQLKYHTHTPGYCHVWKSCCSHCEWATGTSSCCDFLPTVVSFLWKPQRLRSQQSREQHHSDLWRPHHYSPRCGERLKKKKKLCHNSTKVALILKEKNCSVQDCEREESLCVQLPEQSNRGYEITKVALFWGSWMQITQT